VLRQFEGGVRNNFPQAHTKLFGLHRPLIKDDGLQELSRPNFLSRLLLTAK